MKQEVSGTIWHELFTAKKKELKLSLRQLEEMTGIPHSTIDYYLKKERNIPYNNFINLCNALEIEL